MAHRRGLDQEAFSEALGIFGATKIAELAEVNAARQREMGKLRAAGPQRLYALETWFKAKIGDKSNILISTLKEYPDRLNRRGARKCRSPVLLAGRRQLQPVTPRG